MFWNDFVYLLTNYPLSRVWLPSFFSLILSFTSLVNNPLSISFNLEMKNKSETTHIGNKKCVQVDISQHFLKVLWIRKDKLFSNFCDKDGLCFFWFIFELFFFISSQWNDFDQHETFSLAFSTYHLNFRVWFQLSPFNWVSSFSFVSFIDDSNIFFFPHKQDKSHTDPSKKE